LRLNLTDRLLAFSALVLLAAPAAALEVKMTVTDDAKVDRKPGTVASGVPFAKGKIKDLSKLSVTAGGKPVPAQFTKLAVWDDGSIRWALMNCQVEVAAGGKAELVVRDAGGNRPPAAPVKVAESDAGVTMTTGQLTVTVEKKKPGLLTVKLGGKEVIGGGRGPVLWAVGPSREVEKTVRRRKVKTIVYDPGKEIPAGPPHEVKVEQSGPVCAAVCARGKFPGVHDGRLSYTARIYVFAGQKLVKVRFWLENAGGMGYWRKSKSKPTKPNREWLLFDGMALELGSPGFNSAACEGASGSGDFKLVQRSYWNKTGRKLKYNDYEVHTLKDFEFVISGAGGKELKKGERTDGVLTLSGSGGKMTTAIRNFWQQYEKGLELTGGKLRFWFWPIEGQWPRVGPRYSAGLFDDHLKATPRPGLYYLPGSVHKGHELILDLSGRDAKQSAAELSRPLFALASAEYYATTEAAPALFAPPAAQTGEDEVDQKLSYWMNMTRSIVDPASPCSLYAARKQAEWSSISYFGDSTYWYGWMDFGDIPMPGRGPSGLAYDWTLIMLLNAMRTGDVAFMRFGTEMARHRIDVDQLWSDRDPAHCTAIQRAGGFPAFHCYRLYRPTGVGSNHLAGTALYYMLTGEPKALECCERNVEGLKAAWAHIAKTKPWAGPQGDMSANGWSMHAYCSMYAISGEKKWLDEALGLFKTNVTAKRRGLGPHLHDRKQIRSQGYTKDDIKYCYALYPFCLLQYYTGDKALLKLLQEGCDADFPENFFDAPMFLSDMHAFVAMQTGKEDYADDALEHWLEAAPESKCPPVFLKRNSIWNRRAGMHLRAGHLLQYYFWKKSRK
jgi:hypothetical protein